MKILILSCSTGGGHNSAARALKGALEKKGAVCDLYDMHALRSERHMRRASALYSFCAVYAGGLFGALYALAGKISRPNGRSPIYIANFRYAKIITDLVNEHGYDAIVCTHLFPAEAVTRARRKYGLDKKFFFVATDYTCSPFNEETRPDLFFIPHADLSEEYRGVTADQRIALGIPVEEKFLCKSRADAREELAIPEQAKHILIMCGSMGFGRVEQTLRALRTELGTTADECVFTVLGGHNARLNARLRRIFGDTVRVVDFTDQVQIYLNSADILFTKPGGLTTTEAAAVGIPTVHTAPIPGCETKNARFFSERGMSVLYRRRADLARVIALIRDRSLQTAMHQAQKNNINANAADDISDRILKEIA